MVQAAKFLREWGETFPDEASHVSYLGSHLEEAVWYVTLYETCTPELCSVRGFIHALRAQIKDLLEEGRMRNKLKWLRQGLRPVCEF